MAVSIVGTSTPRTRSDGTHIVDMPGGLAEGDYIVLFFFSGETLDGRVTPSGYTEIQYDSIGGPPFVGLAYGKLAGASEPATITFTSTGDTDIQGFAAAFRGVNQTTPLAASNKDIININTETWQPTATPAPTTDNSLLVQLINISFTDVLDAAPTLSPANGWTLQFEFRGPDEYPQNSGAWAYKTADIADGSQTSPIWNPNRTMRGVAINLVLNAAPVAIGGTVTIGGVTYTVTKGNGTPLNITGFAGTDPGDPGRPTNPLGGLTGIHGGNLWIPGSPGTLTTLQRFYDDGLSFDLMVCFFSGPTTSASNSAAWGQCLDSSGSLALNPTYSNLRTEYLSVTIPMNWQLETGQWPVYRSDGGSNHTRIAANLYNVVAAGYYDSVFQYQANAIKNAYPDTSKVIIRIGHEFTNNWGTWSVRPESADAYAAAYRHIHGVFKAILPNALFDWCDLRSFWEPYGAAAYPGDAYVDICGMDIYWRNTDGTPIEGALATSYTNTLTDHLNFAISKGKQVSYPEWGRTGANDPSYIDFMYNWMSALPATGGGSLAYQSYFSFNTGEPFSPYNIQDLPAVYARYQELFHP